MNFDCVHGRRKACKNCSRSCLLKWGVTDEVKLINLLVCYWSGDILQQACVVLPLLVYCLMTLVPSASSICFVFYRFIGCLVGFVAVNDRQDSLLGIYRAEFVQWLTNKVKTRWAVMVLPPVSVFIKGLLSYLTVLYRASAYFPTFLYCTTVYRDQMLRRKVDTESFWRRRRNLSFHFTCKGNLLEGCI